MQSQLIRLACWIDRVHENLSSNLCILIEDAIVCFELEYTYESVGDSTGVQNTAS